MASGVNNLGDYTIEDDGTDYLIKDPGGNVVFKWDETNGKLVAPSNAPLDIAELIDGSGVSHTGELADLADIEADTRVDVSDGGSTIVSEPTDINFTTNLNVTDDGDGTVSVDASGGTDTRIDVSDSGSLVVSEPTDVNFATNLSVTDDGDGTVSVDASGGSFDSVSWVVDHPDVPPIAELQDTESIELPIVVNDTETLEVYRWGAYDASDGTAPTGLTVELLDGGDTIQASANTADSRDSSTPLASYQNSSGSTSIFKLRAKNGTGAAIDTPGVGTHFGYIIA